MRKIKVDLGLVIEVEYPGALDTSVLRRIFRATRGDGDIRKGINMNADIGWYVANKLQISEEIPFIPASHTQKEIIGTREQFQKLHWSRYYINEELIDTVLEVYRKDIDILGYDYIERQLRRL